MERQGISKRWNREGRKGLKGKDQGGCSTRW